jgi:hypothetical protein
MSSVLTSSVLAGLFGIAALALATGLFLAGGWLIRRRPWLSPQAEAEDPPPPLELERTDRRAAVTVGLLAVVLFHAGTVAILSWYYRTHLPHYDSVGSYTVMAQVAQLMRGGDLAAGLHHAGLYHNAWLQSMFAATAGFVLPPTPAGFQLLNTLCVAAFALAAFQIARSLGMVRTKAALASLVVLLPDALMMWNGGYQDMKREPSFLALLGASFFLSLVYLWEPSRGRALVMGVVAGLCVWSRGNALPYLAVVVGPLVGVGIMAWYRQGRLRQEAGGLGVAALAFMVLAAPNLIFTLEGTLARHTDPTITYGRDAATPWASLQYYARSPLKLWTSTNGMGSNSATRHLAQYYALGATAGLVLAGLAVFGWRWQGRVMGCRRQLLFLTAAAWAALATLVLICVIVGWDPRFGLAGMQPLYPTLLLPMAALMVVFSAVRAKPVADARGLKLRWAAVGAVALLLVGAAAHRMVLKARPVNETTMVSQGRELVRLLRAHKSDALIACLTHDRINFDSLAFLEARDGFHSDHCLRRLNFSLSDGRTIDTAAVLPADTDVPAVQQAMLRQIRDQADFVILNTNPDSYQQPESAWNFFLFRHGKPVVEALLNDRRFEPVYCYQLPQEGRYPGNFVVLRNQRKFDPDTVPKK